MTGKTNGRGGARPGAGRKPKPQNAEIKPAKNQTTSSRGGARPGAGRKPKAEAKPKEVAPRRAAKKEELEPQAHGGALKRTKAVAVAIGDCDMLTLMQDIALGRVEATMIQVRAATAALPFLYARKGEGGKKDEQADRAQKAASKFGALAPPLKLVNRK
ncbi:hypothetical protein [Paraburkholderia tuberum]|uniref:Uncharacterized protein n=1 Tax=Paraburkholderia tuberum TaxID=157910 RepID=A0A1H1JB78_9BURK|nr:hypothetical protein [Paraburkholderia tuberum]SDR47171.1 hypothetical protein SAMN05445850_4517 [Paraburkholderia tuberum]